MISPAGRLEFSLVGVKVWCRFFLEAGIQCQFDRYGPVPLFDAILDVVDDAFGGTDDSFEHAGVSYLVSEFPA